MNDNEGELELERRWFEGGHGVDSKVLVSLEITTSGRPGNVVRELERVLAHSFKDKVEYKSVDFTR